MKKVLLWLVLCRSLILSAENIQYEMNVDLDPDKGIYQGHQKITFRNDQKKSTNYLQFFIYPNDPSLKKEHLTISNPRQNGKPLKAEEKGPSLRIWLNDLLEPGESVTVELDFQAQIPVQQAQKDLFSESMEQLRSFLDPQAQREKDYGVFSSTKEILNLGLWYPALCKYDDQGWDAGEYTGMGDVSYFDPADFHLKIRAPSNYSVVISGISSRRIPLSDGRLEHIVEAKRMREVAIELSTGFEQKSALRNGTAIRSHYLSRHRVSGEKVLENAVKAFEYYGKVFGGYPYTELDVVEAPLVGGAGGVEFPGLVTISSMLYRDEVAKTEDIFQQLLQTEGLLDQLLEFVVAHEVAHQWWNAVVGSNSKEHPFLDEAMANYSAVLYFEHFYGRKAAEKQMALHMKMNYQMHRMMGGQDQAVNAPTSTFNGPLAYAGIVYGKGALYFDHLRQLMGDTAFFAAMKKYYQAYSFRIARPDDFFKIAQAQVPEKKESIVTLTRRWLTETHGDEDIGPGTLDALLQTALAINGTELDIDQQELFRQLEELLKNEP